MITMITNKRKRRLEGSVWDFKWKRCRKAGRNENPGAPSWYHRNPVRLDIHAVKELWRHRCPEANA